MKISETCQLFRKEISEFKPEDLVKIEKIEGDLSEDDSKKKESLLSDYNKSINEFLGESFDMEFLVSDVKLSSLIGVEMDYDTSSIVGLLLSAK
jgi:hypothetical protein